MSEHVASFEANLRSAGDGVDDVATAFWTTIDNYLATFRDQPQVTYLWFEYLVEAARKGRLETLERMQDRIAAVFAERVGALGSTEPEEKGQAIFVHLHGAILDHSGTSQDWPAKVRGQIELLVDIEVPRQRAP